MFIFCIHTEQEKFLISNKQLNSTCSAPQGHSAHEHQEHDESLAGGPGHESGWQDQQYGKLRSREPQPQLAQHHLYAKAAAGTPALHHQQVRNVSGTSLLSDLNATSNLLAVSHVTMCVKMRGEKSCWVVDFIKQCQLSNLCQ